MAYILQKCWNREKHSRLNILSLNVIDKMINDELNVIDKMINDDKCLN